MSGLYLTSIEVVGKKVGPKYFDWPFTALARYASTTSLSPMYYGFMDYVLVYAESVSQEDHDWLITNPDVYSFPQNLDTPISDPSIDTFFEGINIPTDWLTPSTTYRELLRSLAGMFLFNQRYSGIALEDIGEVRSIFSSATLDTRLNQMSLQEQGWFLSTVAYYGYNPDEVPLQATLRFLLKRAGDYFASRTFRLGGLSI